MTRLVERAGCCAGPATGPVRRHGRRSPRPAFRETVARTLRVLGARHVMEAAPSPRPGPGPVPGRDLCIVEAVLPDGSGIALLRDLRAAGWQRAAAHRLGRPVQRARRARRRRPQLPRVGRRRRARSAPSPERGAAASDSLSAREIEVLRLVAEGKSNKDIGDALGLSALTVKSHLARIARKLGTGDRAEMVALAMRAGVIRLTRPDAAAIGLPPARPPSRGGVTGPSRTGVIQPPPRRRPAGGPPSSGQRPS